MLTGRMLNDTAGSFKSNPEKIDIFFTRVSIKGDVIWVKRIESSLLYGIILKFKVKDNKGYFLLQYMNSVNEQNYIKVDSTVTLTSAAERLLGSIDISGAIAFYNLDSNITYRN